ncbi:hypothetical protein BH11PSE13_BH11PSE13_27420 [soil metagenome]
MTTATTTTAAAPANFAAAGLLITLEALTDAQLDDLDFGVIGFDSDGIVRRYNVFESQAAGLSPQRVLGHALFTVVAPCMNNFLVAQRFEDAVGASQTLDETVGYVLTLRMRPIKVKLRLLAAPDATARYVLVQRAI